MTSIFKDVSAEDKKMLDQIFWRSFLVFAGPCGMAYRQAPGFTFSIVPAIERYYTTKEERAECMQRHMTPYNITQAVGTFAMGLAASMEKEASQNPDYDVSSIPAIKTSLMGPMSGIGDAIFWGIVRTISASVGISMAAKGSIMGPILFFLLYNIPHVIVRYYMTYLGYSLGETFLKDAYQSGLISILTKCAGIVGMTMVGFMITSTVKMSLALKMTVPGAEPVLIQTYIDQIMEGLLPIGVTFLCYYALKKNMNQNTLVFIVMIVAFILGFVGIC